MDDINQMMREAIALSIGAFDVDNLIANDYYELCDKYDLKLTMDVDEDAIRADDKDNTYYIYLVIELIGPAVSIVGSHRVSLLTVALGSVAPDHASVRVAVIELLDEIITALKLPA